MPRFSMKWKAKEAVRPVTMYECEGAEALLATYMQRPRKKKAMRTTTVVPMKPKCSDTAV